MNRDPDLGLSHERLIKALGIALVEIRATQSLQTAHALADVFHNVPSSIELGLDPDLIAERMLACAERQGVRRYVERLLGLWHD